VCLQLVSSFHIDNYLHFYRDLFSPHLNECDRSDDKYTFTRILANDSLVFDSHFESGNLHSAFRVNNQDISQMKPVGPDGRRQYQTLINSNSHMYDLYMSSDVNTSGHTQWFYFSVSNATAGQRVVFNIRNFTKPDSLYNQGMKPVFYSKKSGKGWIRAGTQVRYFYSSSAADDVTKDVTKAVGKSRHNGGGNTSVTNSTNTAGIVAPFPVVAGLAGDAGDRGQATPSPTAGVDNANANSNTVNDSINRAAAGAGSYVLTFAHVFEYSEDTCYFAYAVPYTYSDLNAYLRNVEKTLKPPPSSSSSSSPVSSRKPTARSKQSTTSSSNRHAHDSGPSSPSMSSSQSPLGTSRTVQSTSPSLSRSSSPFQSSSPTPMPTPLQSLLSTPSASRTASVRSRTRKLQVKTDLFEGFEQAGSADDKEDEETTESSEKTDVGAVHERTRPQTKSQPRVRRSAAKDSSKGKDGTKGGIQECGSTSANLPSALPIRRDIFYRRTNLCYTLAGNKCPLLTITAHASSAEELNRRPTILITARIHPGETVSSWVVQGQFSSRVVLVDESYVCVCVRTRRT
jgi:Cytosolic carboxypeptidase N-terminal domain